jgi:6-pyruvoyltetrahydropterin/6-carboxytetrahydropterin synthase
MHELSKEFRFDAAHTLERVIETESSRRIHGHSYRGEVVIRGRPDPVTGMIIDGGILEKQLENVRSALDHRFLDEMNDLGPATLENLSSYIWNALEEDIDGLSRVTVYRDSSSESCSYFGNQD